MSRRTHASQKLPANKAKHYNRVAKSRTSLASSQSRKQTRGGQQNERLPFAPPEDWHEPLDNSSGYEVIVQGPGAGYRHAVSPDDVRQRLADLPQCFLADLQVVQLSRITRKKSYFPCYGMQWGSALYLYPIEESLIETFGSPPPTGLVNETKMYGGRWSHTAPSTWKLVWTEKTIRDYYLNNILIHELGHLLDDRNSGYVDRERYAEWFAIEYGFRATQNTRKAGPRRRAVRRHHC